MPDAASAPAAAQSQQEQTPDPFAGFITESYRQGEREEPQQPTPAPAPAPSPQQDEQQTPAEREQAETPQQEEGEQQAAEDGEQGGRKKGTLQERINELTRQRHDERRRAEAAEDRMRRLEEELEALRTGGTPPQQARTQPPVGQQQQQPQQPAQQGQEQQGDDPAPDPEQFDYGELDPRFIAATAAHAARQAYREQREAEQREAEQRAQIEQGKTRMTAFVERAQKGAATKYPDFAERVFGDSDKYPISEELGALILESSVGDEIAYHLATHHEEARAIYALSPLDQARSFGRLEARFSAGGSAAPAKPAEEAPVTPRTPPPVLPARGANGRFQTTAATDDFAAFEASVKSQNAG
jgi:hypothetical protein